MPISAVQPIRDRTQRGPSSVAKIRETRVEDYPQIAALHRRNDLAIRPFHEWIALWEGNPARHQRAGHFPLGWVLQAEHGNIVGSIGNVPLAYEFQGRSLRAATAYAWVVDEAYRGYSILILNRFLKQSGVDLFVFTSVSEKAEPIYSDGFQLTRIPVGSWNKSAFWITNYRGFAASALYRKMVPLANSLSYPASAGLALWDGIVKSSDPEPGGYDIQVCSCFDHRFDDFWQQLCQRNPHRLLAGRSRETLEWHFQHARASTTVLAISKRSRMVGYAVFGRQDNEALGLKRVRLVDFQALNGCGAAVKDALAWMLRRCRQERIHVLEVIGSWLDRPDLPTIAAPHQRTLPSWLYYYKAIDPSLEQALKYREAWVPSSFDGDASL
jgi:hypothetical protein